MWPHVPSFPPPGSGFFIKKDEWTPDDGNRKVTFKSYIAAGFARAVALRKDQMIADLQQELAESKAL